MPKPSNEDAVIRARKIIHDAWEQTKAEFQAGAYLKDHRLMKAVLADLEESGHDPIKQVESGHFGLLYSMPINTRYWVDEQHPDGAVDAFDNQEYRQWLARQPETAYLGKFPLFTKDWSKLRKAGE